MIPLCGHYTSFHGTCTLHANMHLLVWLFADIPYGCIQARSSSKAWLRSAARRSRTSGAPTYSGRYLSANVDFQEPFDPATTWHIGLASSLILLTLYQIRGGCAASPRLDVDDDYLRMVEEPRKRRRFTRKAAGDDHGRRVVEAIGASCAPREQQPFAGSRTA